MSKGSAEQVTSSSSRDQDGEDTDGQLQLLTFEVGSEEYAVSILTVQEINRMMQITRVPQCADCVEGVINLRGRIIPVVDLRKRFKLEPSEHTASHRIVVVEMEDRVIGFIVDSVHEVLRIDSSIVEPPPATMANVDVSYVEGVGKLDDRLLILLNLSRLLDVHELGQVDQTIASVQSPDLAA